MYMNTNTMSKLGVLVALMALLMFGGSKNLSPYVFPRQNYTFYGEFPVLLSDSESAAAPVTPAVAPTPAPTTAA